MANKLKAKINNQWVELLGGGSEIVIPSTTSLLKGNGIGGISTAAAGTDYQSPLRSGDITALMLNNDVYPKIREKLNITEALYENIKRPFVFADKKCSWYGDSIVAGYYGTGLVTENSFSKLFTGKAGGIYSGHGVGGATICGEYESRVIAWHLHDGAESDADIIFVAGGTNDHSNQKPLGTFADENTHLTFYGALKEICTNLQTYNPNAKVIFITPINKTVKVSNETTTLDQYRKAIYEVATSFGYSVIDGSKVGFWSSGVTTGTWGIEMMGDKVHPTLKGHQLYADYLCGKLL